MKYKSPILKDFYYEIEIDLLADLKEQLKSRLVNSGVKTTSSNPIYDFFNFKKRYIEPKPRIIKKSKEFSCPIGYEVALAEIENKISTGGNLVPYLSKQIKDAGYSDGILLAPAVISCSQNRFHNSTCFLSQQIDREGVCLLIDRTDAVTVVNDKTGLDV